MMVTDHTERTAANTDLVSLEAGDHACWVVDSPVDFATTTTRIFADGARLKQKSVLLGPARRLPTGDLPPGVIVTDPYGLSVDGGVLEPERLVGAFELQSDLALQEGFAGLRVVADVDWVLPAAPDLERIIDFEMTIDAVVRDLKATAVCAYRPASFAATTIEGARCVHRLRAGGDGTEPPFTMTALDSRSWRLAGEVDLAVHRTFLAALRGGLRTGRTFDVSDLHFIDLTGMRLIGVAALDAGGVVTLVRPTPLFRRLWDIAGFGELCPGVVLRP